MSHHLKFHPEKFPGCVTAEKKASSIKKKNLKGILNNVAIELECVVWM